MKEFTSIKRNSCKNKLEDEGYEVSFSPDHCEIIIVNDKYQYNVFNSFYKIIGNDKTSGRTFDNFLKFLQEQK